MRIAIITGAAPTLLNFRGPLIAELIGRGHEVLAIAPDHDEATRSALLTLGARPVDWPMARAGMSIVADLAALARLWRLLRQTAPDLVFAYTIKSVVYGTLAAVAAGVRRRYALVEGLGFAFTEGAADDADRRKARRFASLLYRAALARVARAIFLNPDDRAEFVRLKLVDEGRSEVLGAIGLDLDQWPCTAPPTDPVTFLMVARVLRDKGVREFAEAAGRLKSEDVRARFILVGDLDANPTAIPRDEVRAWVDRGWIEWPGFAPVRPWLAQASVFVLPSYREGVPLSTQEAMATGRPVITTDVPGCRETVIEGVNGYFVPPRDPKALAEAMRRFVDHPERIAPMGRESRRLAEERFDVHVQNARLLDLMGFGAVGDLVHEGAIMRGDA